MEETPYEKAIPVAQLLLDSMNPRLPDVQESQHDAIKAMVRVQGDKVVALAQHLVENGPSQNNLLIVVPSDDDDEPDTFCVLDGNRRLTALKLLESPSLAERILAPPSLQKLKRLSDKFEVNPITELRCVVYADREDADTWIQLAHRGQNQGAGLVEWDGQVAARYDARKGSKAPELQVLDYVREKAKLSESTRQLIDGGKFPITTLKRLINTPYVRKKLGIDREDGHIVTQFPEEEVLKGLVRVVEDLATGRYTVSKLKSQDQRIDYINGFDKEELPDSGQSLAQNFSLGEQPKTSAGPTNSTTTPRAPRQAHNRSTLIPKECKLNITHQRVQKIYLELKKLNIYDYPNAGAVMFRVFIELSLDTYLEKKAGWPEIQVQGTKLVDKINAVATHLENNMIMTTNELAPVRRAAGGQTLLVASVRTMHGYVHNRHFTAIPGDIKIAWDELQLFVEKMWA